MLTLLTPAGLWALAALALPLAIHLWRPPPRTVRLGSLRFLDNLPHRRIRNLRWREYTLLATRLALLTALALLLAGPRWIKKPYSGPQRWALLDPTAAPVGDSLDRLRRLRADGYSVHRLTPGLPLFDSSAAPGEGMTPPDLWSLLREADAALPTGSTLAVFTPGRIAALRGTRPALRHCRVEWVPTPDAAGTAPRSWIESLRAFSPPGKPLDVHVVVGTSDARSTRFAPGGPPGPAVEMAPDGSRVRLAGTESGPWMTVASRSSPLRVSILHDADRAGDARYLEAAVTAVGATSGQPVSVSVRSLDGNLPAIRDAVDWAFWLSASAPPNSWLNGAPNFVRDAGTGPHDLPATTEGWIVALPDSPGAAALAAAPLHLWRRIPTLPGNAEALWTDGQGKPLLTLERAAYGRRHWRFYSRFHPDWTDLPRTSVLAAMLRDLFFPPPPAIPADPAHDLRLADPLQYYPTLSSAAGSAEPPASARPPDTIDLHWPLWLLAVFLFMAERLLNRRPSQGSLAVPTPPQPAVSTAR